MCSILYIYMCSVWTILLYIYICVVCVYVCCRRGNDSQVAVSLLKEMLREAVTCFKLLDLIGGLHSWSDVIDPTFPKY